MRRPSLTWISPFLAAGLALLLFASLTFIGSIAPALGEPAGNINNFAGGGAGTGMASDLPQQPEGLLLLGSFLYLSDFQFNAVRRIDLKTGQESVVAGTGSRCQATHCGDGGPATEAQLYQPRGLAADGSGNIYVAEYGAHRVRRIDTAGRITTFAGGGNLDQDGIVAAQARLVSPGGLAIGADDALYVSESSTDSRIRKIDTLGLISTVVGPGSTANFEPSEPDRLSSPLGLSFDPRGGLLIADRGNHRIRRWDPASNLVTTVAGSSQATGFSGDGGPATNAGLTNPHYVLAHASGNILIADTGNARIRMVAPDGVIRTVAGNGGSGVSPDGRQAVLAQIGQPRGLAIDDKANVYIADAANRRLRKVNSAGSVATVAGNGLNIQFDPAGMAVDPNGKVYFAEPSTHRVRVAEPGGAIRTFAGTGVPGFSGDGSAAGSSRLNTPQDVAIDNQGNILIADKGNARIRKVDPSGKITTLIGAGLGSFYGDGGPATEAYLQSPVSLAIDSVGNIYIADAASRRVRRVDTQGLIATVAGNGSSTRSGDEGPAVKASIGQASDVAVDAGGNIFISDGTSVRKVDSTGVITRFAGDGIATFDSTTGGLSDGQRAWKAKFTSVGQIATDRFGNLFLNSDFRIRKVDKSGRITTVAGSGVTCSGGACGDGGPALAATIRPTGLTVDSKGQVYVSQSEQPVSIQTGAFESGRIRVVDATSDIPGSYPTVSSVSPASVPRGAANQVLTMIGSNLQAGASVQVNGGGVTVNSVEFQDGQHMALNVTVAVQANPGKRTVVVTNPDEASAFCSGCITVVPVGDVSPGVAYATPPSLPKGKTWLVRLTGRNLRPGAAASVSGSGVIVEHVAVDSADPFTAVLRTRLSSTAEPGPREVRFTNPDGTSGICAACVTVANPPPFINRMSPESVLSGTGQASIQVEGVHFRPGARVSLVGATIDSVQVVDSERLKVDISANGATPLGERMFDVVNSDGTYFACPDCFRVLPVPPLIARATPAMLPQGASSWELELTGSNFAPGAAAWFSDPDVVVNSMHVKDSKSMAMTVSVDRAASPGPKMLTVVSPDEVFASCPDCFAVTKGDFAEEEEPKEPIRKDPPIKELLNDSLGTIEGELSMDLNGSTATDVAERQSAGGRQPSRILPNSGQKASGRAPVAAPKLENDPKRTPRKIVTRPRGSSPMVVGDAGPESDNLKTTSGNGAGRIAGTVAKGFLLGALTGVSLLLISRYSRQFARTRKRSV